MHDSVTVHMDATPEQVWALVSDVTRIGEFSPETFEAEWLDGATGPAVGAKFRGHVKRNEIGPIYWTTCRVTACEPGREFGFAVLAGDKAVKLIRDEPDARIISMVDGWPMNFAAKRAEALGFTAEKSFDEIIRIHIEDELGGRIGG